MFERIQLFLQRLNHYTTVQPTPAMTELLGNIFAEVLVILALSTKAMKERRIKRFLKRLIGKTEVEDAFARLDMLTKEECLMTAARILEMAHHVDHNMTAVREVVDGVDGNVIAIKEAVGDVGDVVNATKEATLHLHESVTTTTQLTHDVREDVTVLKEDTQAVDRNVKIIKNAIDSQQRSSFPDAAIIITEIRSKGINCERN
ncbi:hypothetical protein F5148DRAFT_503511 [Russula earlei]|uniref:Uncharacterized protein n=1 Tax=Russula earlei TaxID=71964 RepID=A0ACC0TX51_9AGAM|nr:hypothetical protein F5148DRAFT_503511 [Russula earlei]